MHFCWSVLDARFFSVIIFLCLWTFHCLICGAGDGSHGIWGMSILRHMLLGDCFYIRIWWYRILCGFYILCKRWQHDNWLNLMWLGSGLSDNCVACQRGWWLSYRHGEFLICFSLWYWCHGVLIFGDDGLFRVACSLALLVHVVHLCFCCDFDVMAYCCWCEAWTPLQVARIYGFSPCGYDGVSHSGMIILN